MKIHRLFFFLFLFVTKISTAQTVTEIFGKVTDAKTKEARKDRKMAALTVEYLLNPKGFDLTESTKQLRSKNENESFSSNRWNTTAW